MEINGWGREFDSIIVWDRVPTIFYNVKNHKGFDGMYLGSVLLVLGLVVTGSLYAMALLAHKEQDAVNGNK